MRIGPIQLPVPFCQAGLAGYSDRAMRLVARRRGCPYAVTEALLDVIMLSGGQGLRKSIDINDEDHPLAGQVMGSEPHTMAAAARILWERDYDVIDLNFACPVKKIKNKARGGHMLLDVPRGLSVLRAVRDALPDAPLSVSLRRGFDDSPDAADRFYRIVDEAWALGFAAVRVHGRTVQQKYVGRASWPFLAEVKRRYPDRTILGSGDVFTAEDAVRMLAETGVDVVWIARGAIGNPWIFRHATALLGMRTEDGADTGATGRGTARPVLVGESEDTGLRVRRPVAPSSSPQVDPSSPSVLLPPSIGEQREALDEHFSLAMQLHGEELAGRRMRKMGIKYSRFHPSAAEVKAGFINIRSQRDWTAVLDRWYAADGPGVWPAANAADEVNDGGGSSDPADLQSCAVE
jgi:tRNA-dihydrouridine synthase